VGPNELGFCSVIEPVNTLRVEVPHGNTAHAGNSVHESSNNQAQVDRSADASEYQKEFRISYRVRTASPPMAHPQNRRPCGRFSPALTPLRARKRSCSRRRRRKSSCEPVEEATRARKAAKRGPRAVKAAYGDAFKASSRIERAGFASKTCGSAPMIALPDIFYRRTAIKKPASGATGAAGGYILNQTRKRLQEHHVDAALGVCVSPTHN
jgi:hypothetical protein